MKKKILLVIEGSHLSESVLEYGVQIAKSTNSLLEGVFMRDLRYSMYVYPILFDQMYIDRTVYTELIETERTKIEAAVKLFTERCVKENIAYKVHLDQEMPIERLINESAYADLIIMDARTDISDLLPETPSSSLRDILIDAFCPSLIVPKAFMPVENIILTYDGSHSSTFAIRMFSYIFPELATLKTYLLSVDEHNASHLRNDTNIRELITRRYSDISYEVRNGHVIRELKDFIVSNSQHSLVVMGAYGRSALSRLWRQSLANTIIKEAQVPIFISHQ
jgi:nucleotide-binding universal stress UspA family protein